MAVRSHQADFDLATRIIHPVLKDVCGDVMNDFPLIQARTTPELFATAGLDAFATYLTKLNAYSIAMKPFAPEVGDTLSDLIFKVIEGHALVMKKYPRARRAGLSLTQVFKQHEAAIGLFVNYIHSSRSHATLRDDRLMAVALEAQKTVFIPQ